VDGGVLLRVVKYENQARKEEKRKKNRNKKWKRFKKRNKMRYG
jgi:hypothetical protein